MKKKAVTTILIVIVILIWGNIIYSALSASSGDSVIPSHPNKEKKDTFNDYSITRDTTKLSLNYHDPFGISKLPDTGKVLSKPKNIKRQIVAIIKPHIDWSFIKYSGFIRNPSSKKMITLISINEKNETLYEGQKKDGVKLLKNLRDSIRIEFNGLIKVITIKPSS